jgi:hypothetical protein
MLLNRCLHLLPISRCRDLNYAGIKPAIPALQHRNRRAKTK